MKENKLVVYLNIPEQDINETLITNVVLSDDDLNVKLAESIPHKLIDVL